MTHILIGIIILIVAYIASKTVPYLSSRKNIVRTLAGVIFIILLIAASFVQVEPGMVGVKKLFGKVSNNTLESGLNLINPLAKVVMFDMRTQNYTMSGIRDEGTQQTDDAIHVLSADGLEVIVDLTVLFKIVPTEAPRILKEIGTDYRNVLVQPVCRTGIRDNAVYYDAVSLYSTKRDEFQDRIFSAIESSFR